MGTTKRRSRSLITALPLMWMAGCVDVIDEPLPEPTFRNPPAMGLPEAGEDAATDPMREERPESTQDPVESERDESPPASFPPGDPPAGDRGAAEGSPQPGAGAGPAPMAAGAAQAQDPEPMVSPEYASDAGVVPGPAEDATEPDPPADDEAKSPPEDAKGSPGCGNTAFPSAGAKLIKVNDVQREFIIELPPNYDPSFPYRLVFAWHGIGETAAVVASDWYGLAEYAASDAIFIAGQGLSDKSRNGGLTSWAIQPDESDMDYTRAMLDWAEAQYCIDTQRIFSIGASNGGMMSNIVGCELGETLRGIAVIAGNGPQFVATAPCLGQVAVWIAHGNLDQNVPFAQGVMSRDFWLRDNSCSQDSMASEPALCRRFQGCDPLYPVEFCEFDGGQIIPDFAAEAAWNFFARL